MKTIFSFVCMVAFSLSVHAQASADSLAIEKAVRDYVEGWQSGDTERVSGAVSPELAKRAVMSDDKNHYFISDMSASLLVFVTLKNKDGIRMPDLTPEEPFKLYVKILDISGNVASAKAWNTKYGFLDYCHLARYGESWKIVNVLWDYLPK